jgi:hypothetical protein
MQDTPAGHLTFSKDLRKPLGRKISNPDYPPRSKHLHDPAQMFVAGGK